MEGMLFAARVRSLCPQPVAAGLGTPGFPLLCGKGTSSRETSHNLEALEGG